MLSDDLIQEQAYLVSRGVRPLALLESVRLEPAEMINTFVRLNQVAVDPAIPFVLPRRDMNCAMTGFAAAPWVIELLQWSYDHAPLRQHHRIIGLLLGYSVSAIAEHDSREFAGQPKDQSTSTQQRADSKCMA